MDKSGIPIDAYFTETHEYIRMVDKDIARIGITEYAAEQLGDIVFVELPEAGEMFEKSESYGSIESVKASSELYVPVTCEITAINDNLADEPGLINDDAFGTGWMLEVNVTNLSELEGLMDHKAYTKFIADLG